MGRTKLYLNNIRKKEYKMVKDNNKCPKCNGVAYKVVDRRVINNYILELRQCLNIQGECCYRWKAKIPVR